MEEQGSKLGVVQPHHAHQPPQGGQQLGLPWQGGDAVSPVASPLGMEADAPAPRLEQAERAPLQALPGAETEAITERRKPKRQREHVVGVRLDEGERDKLVALAAAKKLSIGAFLRLCSLETAGPRARRSVPVDRELLARANADLNRIGNNLNQIARALNVGTDTPPHMITDVTGELRNALSQLRQALGYDR